MGLGSLRQFFFEKAGHLIWRRRTIRHGARSLRLKLAQGGHERDEVLPDERVNILTGLDQVLRRFIIMIDPIEEGVPDHLFVESFASLQESHCFEKVEDRFGFQNLTCEQTMRSLDALSFLGSPEEVIFLSEEEVDGLIEACAMDLPGKRSEGEDGSGR